MEVQEQNISIEKNTEIDGHDSEGELIVDATATPQDISYATELNLLNDAREKAEELIDVLYNPLKHNKKPRTYREVARKVYLKTAQKKIKSTKEIRSAIRKQLGYLNRSLKYIDKLLNSYNSVPLNRIQYKYLLVIQTLRDQQQEMFIDNKHSIEHRIVSIHQSLMLGQSSEVKQMQRLNLGLR